MPMACKTSALRRLASSNALRAAAKPTDALAGPRVANSVVSVSTIKISAPTSAAMPIRGWNRKQIAEIERHPRQVEQGPRTGAAEKAADLVEIAHRLQPVAPACVLSGRRTMTS